MTILSHLEDLHANDLIRLSVCCEFTGLQPKKQQQLLHFRKRWEQQVSAEESKPGQKGGKEMAHEVQSDVTAQENSCSKEKPHREGAEAKTNRSLSEESFKSSDHQQGMHSACLTAKGLITYYV